MPEPPLRVDGFVVAILAALALAAFLGLLGLLLLRRRLKRIDLPPDADFVTTLRAVPLGLVVALDLLDLGLDFLAAPIAWAILSRYRLGALRRVATLEAIVPFTQAIPLLTASWLLVRWRSGGTAGGASSQR